MPLNGSSSLSSARLSPLSFPPTSTLHERLDRPVAGGPRSQRWVDAGMCGEDRAFRAGATQGGGEYVRSMGVSATHHILSGLGFAL
jgi:hypothetical protein